MTSDVAALTIIHYQDIPGIELLRSFGQKILALVLMTCLIREAYRFAHGGTPNFFRPIAKVAMGFVVLWAMPTIGDTLATLVQSLSRGMADENHVALFGRSIATALQSSPCETEWYNLVGLLFTVRGWLTMASNLVFFAMFLSKIVIIDVLFPVCFGLVLFAGVLSVPVSLIPGMGGMTGWVRNLIEVSLWPIVFQFLVALLAATFPHIIANVAGGQVVLDCSTVTEPMSMPLESRFFMHMQYLAVCCTYLVLVWFTPLLSSVVVRSAPVGVVGGIVAAKAGSMIGRVGSGVARSLVMKPSLGAGKK